MMTWSRSNSSGKGLHWGQLGSWGAPWQWETSVALEFLQVLKIQRSLAVLHPHVSCASGCMSPVVVCSSGCQTHGDWDWGRQLWGCSEC